MKYAIRYYTKSGHTQLLAEKISEVINVPALNTENKLTEDVDILFLGSSIYGNSIDPAVAIFMEEIDVNVGMIINFSTAGILESAYDQVANLSSMLNLNISEDEFHCPGQFVGINIGRPNEKDLDDIVEFTKKIVDKYDS